MKLFLLIATLLLGTLAHAQVHDPGGGQLDPTKPTGLRQRLNFQKIEKFFKKTIDDNWKKCGYTDKNQPETIIGFYQDFKNEKNSIDPKDLIKPSKAVCIECMQDKLKGHEGGNFLCLINNEGFQKVAHALVKYPKQAKDYINKQAVTGVSSLEVINFYEMFLIDYK